jgi:hypothetical protein
MSRLAGVLIAGLSRTSLHLVAADRQAFEGKPSFKEGRDLGYYVWTDGDTWHVRCQNPFVVQLR